VVSCGRRPLKRKLRRQVEDRHDGSAVNSRICAEIERMRHQISPQQQPIKYPGTINAIKGSQMRLR